MKFLTTLAVLPLALAACSKNDSTGNVDQPAAAPVAAAAAPAGQNWTETVVKTPEGMAEAYRRGALGSSSLPFIVAGVLLLLGRTDGVYWTVPGVLLSFAAGVFGAWVLLIEIQR